MEAAAEQIYLHRAAQQILREGPFSPVSVTTPIATFLSTLFPSQNQSINPTENYSFSEL